ncbi:MAG: DUF1800 domain-containing protein [Bacteroidota bacterium]
MKLKRMAKTFTVGAGFTVLFAFTQSKQSTEHYHIKLPYKKAGLTERQAAAHLLSRFSFGARPGEVDEVLQLGLENWLDQQLAASLPDSSVARRLQGMEALNLSNETIANTYLTPAQVIRIAVKNKLISKDSTLSPDKKEYRDQIKVIMDKEGLKPFIELQTQLINQKIIRAAYSNNQLQEVMTDFWFNHFNVSLTKPQCQQFILTYERDAIRPNVFGEFKTILLATAKHPAMLEYLDNASSVSNNNDLSKRPGRIQAQKKIEAKINAQMAENSNSAANGFIQQALSARKVQGLNENYAREVMELHTLGVDGGYTQKDVTEVARALTGWSVTPLLKDGIGKNIMDKMGAQRMEKNGFITEGDFLYRADKHDDSAKSILGKSFPARGGYQEGVEVLEMLSSQPNTAKFICKKIAVRFVSDQPSQELLNKMSDTYLKHHGNIKEVLLTMVNSVEFWKEDALREKIKSPFELAISSIRATNADVKMPMQIFNWCSKMGQRFYFYQAPTGFPDRAAYWINTGSLLNRMNFGLAFATGKIPGVTLDLLGLNQHHEPESAEDALRIYSQLLLPERNQDANIKRLTALINDNKVGDKIDAAANNTPSQNSEPESEMMLPAKAEQKQEKAMLSKKNKPFTLSTLPGNNTTVAQVTGVIIGSPEFQRK